MDYLVYGREAEKKLLLPHRNFQSRADDERVNIDSLCWASDIIGIAIVSYGNPDLGQKDPTR